MITILFDGDGFQLNGLARRFERFLFRSREGQSLSRIADAPYFVDSSITVGTQIADMMVAVVRLYFENALRQGTPEGDAFLSAVARYYGVVSGLTVDLETPQGPLYGIYRMPERAHYGLEQASAEELDSQ